MSKSLGNFTSLLDLLERADPRAYRLLVLRAHYRSPIEVTPSTVDQAEKALARLDDLARRFDVSAAPAGVSLEQAAAGGADADALAGFVEHMDDDLDTPGALAAVFDLVRRANSAADDGDEDEGRRLAATVVVLCGALGLALGGSASTLDPETAALVADRDRARAAGDYDQADADRRELEARGWVVEDSPQGTRLHRRSGS